MTASTRVLVTCPPMLRMMPDVRCMFDCKGIEVTTPAVVQTLSVADLLAIVPQHDGWIIGDDPATREVFRAGRAGRLRAAVKWGVGVDNVDFAACRELSIPVVNTPGMFGEEVADIAIGYLIALARETFLIDRGVRAGEWPKPRGISLRNKICAVLGFGDIGRNFVKRALGCGMQAIVYDPAADVARMPDGARLERWPESLEQADFLVVTCALNATSRHIVNAQALLLAKAGIRIVNVSRGPVIDEFALIDALRSGHVHSAALDVFEAEPLPQESALRQFERCVFGSHNASNTVDAVLRTSRLAVNRLFGFLGVV